MTFVELLLLVESQGEKILYQEVNSLITDQHLYDRPLESTDAWALNPTPGKPEKVYSKSGDRWRWTPDVELEE